MFREYRRRNNSSSLNWFSRVFTRRVFRHVHHARTCTRVLVWGLSRFAATCCSILIGHVRLARATLANSFDDAVSFLAPRKCLHIWPDLFLSLSLVLTGRRRGARDTTQSIHTARWSRLDWTADRLRTVARRLHARNACIGALRLSCQLSKRTERVKEQSIDPNHSNGMPRRKRHIRKLTNSVFMIRFYDFNHSRI